MAQSGSSSVPVWRVVVLIGSAGTAIGLIGKIPWLGLVAGPVAVIGVVGLLIAQRAPAHPTAPVGGTTHPARPTAWHRWVWVAAAVAVAAGTAYLLFQPSREDQPVKPGPARVPLGLYMTEEIIPGPCAGTTTQEYAAPDGSGCVKLAATGGLEVRQLQAVQVRDESDGGNEWVVAVTFAGEDATRFTDLSRQLSTQPQPRNQLAVVMGSRILSHPVVLEPLTGGTAMIATGLSQAEAQAVARDLGVG
jgi:hypothetical protein